MSREQIEELLDAANRPRAEVVITQEDDTTESLGDLATRRGTEHTNRTGEQQ
jgi:hypothetical protein